MKKGRRYTQEEIVLISQSAIGKTFRELMNSELITFESEENKGNLGQLVETYLFGIDSNNDSEPDFIDAGIELKVTPYKRNKDNTLSAKERLVLNIIDYMNEYKNEFKSSHFWYKNNKIQLLWYLSTDKASTREEKMNFIITHEHLLNLYESEDLKQIEEDWNYIISKIKDGKAHELSEADTMYLGACTKGENSKSYRRQPFSNMMAMQRAFCFKQSYMTQLVRKYIGDYNDVEKIIKDKIIDFNTYINKTISQYIGLSQFELMNRLNITSTSKSVFSIIINRMFNVSKSLRDTDEFLKANIIPKTIRVEENGKIKESMSFPYFKFSEIVNIPFESSNIRNELETTKYLFFVFKKVNGEYIFKGIKLWNMPEMTIEDNVRKMYEKTQGVLKSGNIIKEIKNGVRLTNFPGMAENKVCHVRPHGRNSADTSKLPVPDKLTGLTEYTKQCFWFNNSYISEIISDLI